MELEINEYGSMAGFNGFCNYLSFGSAEKNEKTRIKRKKSWQAQWTNNWLEKWIEFNFKSPSHLDYSSRNKYEWKFKFLISITKCIYTLNSHIISYFVINNSDLLILHNFKEVARYGQGGSCTPPPPRRRNKVYYVGN